MSNILKRRRQKKGKKVILNFTIEGGIPLEDKVFENEEFVDFLKSNIKVNGKKGQLGTQVQVVDEGQRVRVTAEAPFSKRYLKYLTKKYLKRIEIKDYVHVIASNQREKRNAYELRYYKVPDEE